MEEVAGGIVTGDWFAAVLLKWYEDIPLMVDAHWGSDSLVRVREEVLGDRVALGLGCGLVCVGLGRGREEEVAGLRTAREGVGLERDLL